VLETVVGGVRLTPFLAFSLSYLPMLRYLIYFVGHLVALVHSCSRDPGPSVRLPFPVPGSACPHVRRAPLWVLSALSTRPSYDITSLLRRSWARCRAVRRSAGP
jgi:hypothetical protein